jgi:hypothetical protein
VAKHWRVRKGGKKSEVFIFFWDSMIAQRQRLAGPRGLRNITTLRFFGSGTVSWTLGKSISYCATKSTSL